MDYGACRTIKFCCSHKICAKDKLITISQPAFMLQDLLAFMHVQLEPFYLQL